MEGQLTVPLHFAAEFLILAVAIAACLDALRRARSGAGWAALAQGAGFALLGASQVLHGTLRIPEDGAVALIAMRTAAFGLIAVGAGLPLPTAGAPALFVAGPDAALAVLPAVAASVVAARGFLAHRSEQDPASFAFTLAFACFAAGELLTVLASPEGGNALATGHAVRAAGALLLARWQWASIVRSVRLRFVAAFVAVLLMLVLVLSSALNIVLSGNLEREELDRLAETARATTTATESQAVSAARDAKTFAGTIARGIGDGEAEPFPRSERLLEIFPLDFLVFLGDGLRVVSSAQRASVGGRTSITRLQPQLEVFVTGSEAVEQASRRRTEIHGIDTVGTTQMAAFGVVPVVVGNRVRGVVVAGYWLDRVALAQTARPASAQLTILSISGRVIATTVEGDPSTVADALTGGARGSAIRRVVLEQRTVLKTDVAIKGSTWFAAYAPLRSSSGKPIGSLVAARPSTVVGASQEDVNQTLFLLTLIASAVAAVLAWTAGRRFTRPIRSLTAAAEAVRGGDLEARARIESSDEVGALGASFNEMTASLARITDDLRRTAAVEAALRVQVETIMQSMGDGLIAIDAEGRIFAFNRAAERMTGVEAHHATGRELGEVLHGVDAAGRALAAAAAEGGTVRDGVLRRADGFRVDVALSSTPLEHAPGAEAGRVIVVRDVSAEIQAERMKSEFLSNVSHELRTPLTPIKGYTEILRRRNFPREKATSFLDGILESTSRLERIVEILVDFAAMEAGRLQPRTEPIALKPLVEEHLNGWRERDKVHRFVAKVPSTLPAVLADRRLLAKCLEELLDNAVKFSPEGGSVAINAAVVSNGSRSRRLRKMRIDVTDQGIGISEEELPSLFQDFRQLDGSETRQFGGLGLGLAYVKRVAVVHGGDVGATSVPGRGSTFSLLLPLADTKGGTAGREARPRTSRGVRPTARRGVANRGRTR